MQLDLQKKSKMTNSTPNTNQSAWTSSESFSLNAQQRHDLKAALLSVRWAGELLKTSDESQVPRELIAEQLLDAFRRLQPFVEKIIIQEETSPE